MVGPNLIPISKQRSWLSEIDKPLVLARYCIVRWWLGTFLIIEGRLGSSAAALGPWINYEKGLGHQSGFLSASRGHLPKYA